MRAVAVEGLEARRFLSASLGEAGNGELDDAPDTPALHVAASRESEPTASRVATEREVEGDTEREDGGQPRGAGDQNPPSAPALGAGGDNLGGDSAPVEQPTSAQPTVDQSSGAGAAGSQTSTSLPTGSGSAPTPPAAAEKSDTPETQSEDRPAAAPSRAAVIPAKPATRAVSVPADPMIDPSQSVSAGQAPRSAPTVTTATVERPPRIDAAPAKHSPFGVVPITADGAAVHAIAASIAPAASDAAEVVSRFADAVARAAAACRALPLPAAAYHFASVNAPAFRDALDRFINECATLGPGVVIVTSPGRHRRAWAVTAAVVAADLAALGAHVRRRSRRKAATPSDAAGPRAVPA